MENNGQQSQWPFGNLVLPEGASVTVNNSVINGDQHNYYAPVYNSGKEVVEEDIQEESRDPWRSYFKSDEDYEEAVLMAKTCVKAQHIKNRIVIPFKEKGYDKNVLVSLDFIEAMIIHLENYEGAKETRTIQRSLY